MMMADGLPVVGESADERLLRRQTLGETMKKVVGKLSKFGEKK